MRFHVSFFVVLAFVSAIFCSCSKEDAEKDVYKSFPKSEAKITLDGKVIFFKDKNISEEKLFYRILTGSFETGYRVYALITRQVKKENATNNTTDPKRFLDDGSLLSIMLPVNNLPQDGQYEVIFDKDYYDLDVWNYPVIDAPCKLCYWGKDADGQEWIHLEGDCKITNAKEIAYEELDLRMTTKIKKGYFFDVDFNIKFKSRDGKIHKLSGKFKHINHLNLNEYFIPIN